MRQLTWWAFANDVHAVVDASNGADIAGGGERPRRVGIGHSMGGAAMVMAELQRPGCFDALVLVEPIVFPPEPSASTLFKRTTNTLVEQALKRRATFASPDDIRAYLSPKPLFSQWSADALSAYIDGGFYKEAEGDWRLRCRPAWESRVFSLGTHDAFKRLGEIRIPGVL